MPAAARYSTATKQLAADLRARGHNVGCRALERWAELGLAPAPVRYSLGKRGFGSRYPPGAVEQYAAVASVMRRGLDWRVAGLQLISRGYLPVREGTFRLLLNFLLPDDVDSDDPLGRAEEEFGQAGGNRLFEKMSRVAQKNLASAKVVDPVTGQNVSGEAAAAGAMIWTLAAMLGEPLPEGSAEEIAGASGLISPALPETERRERIRYTEAVFSGPSTFRALSAAAQTVEPARLQSIILGMREIAACGPFEGVLPEQWMDMLLVATALTVTTIEDLGGLAWLRSMGVFNQPSL